MGEYTILHEKRKPKHKQFDSYFSALSYLNRGGHYFGLRNQLSSETLIAIANDIYNIKSLEYV